MARINLRPWREELRAEKQKQFVSVLFGFLIISAGAGFLWYQQVLGSIDYQRQRNNYVKNEITQLEKQIKEISELKKKRTALIERMQVIQDLQGKRPVIVRLFDELVRTVPEGVYLTSWTRKQDSLAIQGVGDSNSRISNLMRSLDTSNWYQDPNLTSVKAIAENKSAFEMTVRQETPKLNTGGEG
jgi:type IV pilus assembly protein PilN